MNPTARRIDRQDTGSGAVDMLLLHLVRSGTPERRDRRSRRRSPPHTRTWSMAAKRLNVESLGSYFESLPDPRHQRNRRHLLVDIIVISVCAILCGCDGPTAIHRWATHNKQWLQGFLKLPNGIPSRDCIRRVLIALQAGSLSGVFSAMDRCRDYHRRGGRQTLDFDRWKNQSTFA